MATAIYDPNFIDQYSATRYTPTTKEDLLDRSTRAYWESQQDKRRKLAGVRAQEQMLQEERDWEEGENQKQRDWEEEQARLNRDAQKDIAANAEEGALAGTVAQVGSMGLMGDMMFNKGEFTKGAIGMAKSGVNQLTGGRFFGEGNLSEEAVREAAELQQAQSVASGIPTPPPTVAPVTSAEPVVSGVNAAAPTVQTGTTAATEGAATGAQGQVLSAGTEGVLPGPAGVEQVAFGESGMPVASTTTPMPSAELAEAGMQQTVGGAEGALPTQSTGIFTSGYSGMMSGALTAAGGVALNQINKNLKGLYTDFLGETGGELAYRAGRAGSTALAGAGVGAMLSSAELGILGSNPMTAPIAIGMVVADVTSGLLKSDEFQKFEKFVEDIPVVGPIADAVFLEPAQWLGGFVDDVFGGIEDVFSMATGGFSWVCTEVSRTNGKFDSDTVKKLNALLQYGFKEHGKITKWYFKNGHVVAKGIAKSNGVFTENYNLRKVLIDRCISLMDDGSIEGAFQHYISVMIELYKIFAPLDVFAKAMELVEEDEHFFIMKQIEGVTDGRN